MNPAWTALILNQDLRDQKLVAADITDSESEGAGSYPMTGSGYVSGNSRRPICTWKKWFVNVALCPGYLLEKLV